MNTPGTFLWDWNGTLVNDVALCSQLLNSQLQRHGHAPLGGIQARVPLSHRGIL